MKIPSNVVLQEDEQLIAIVRRYALTYFWWYVLIFFLFIGPFFFLFFLFAKPLWGPAIFVISILISIFLIIRISFLWVHNQFIVTTHRVIDVDQRGFFDRTVSEVPYEKVDDVSYEVKGVMETLFHYGQLNIKMGGGMIDLEIHRIHHPERVHRLVMEYQQGYALAQKKAVGKEFLASIINRLGELGQQELVSLRNVIDARLQLEDGEDTRHASSPTKE